RLPPPWVAPAPPGPATSGDTETAWWIRAADLGPAKVAILGGVELAGRAGEVTVLVGANGSGKTTLLRSIAGLVAPLAGRIERAPGRVAYLPQDPGALLHRPSVLDEVRWTIDRAGAVGERPEAMLEAFGIAALGGTYP